jgi:chemotaxis protein MotB
MNATGRRRRGSRLGDGAGDGAGEHGSSERWLVSYADLITLLFAFFVVLFAISQADLKKFREVSESVRRAFQGTSSGPLFPGSSRRGGEGGEGEGAPEAATPGQDSGGLEGSLAPAFPDSREAHDPAVERELEEIRRLIEEAIEFEESTARAVQLETGASAGALGPRLRWVIQDSYPIRGSELAPDFHPLLSRVARVLAKYPGRQVTLEGHADPQEQAPSDPRSWRLAFSRAEQMARFLTDRGVGSARLELSSRGDESPLGRDSGPWARARNRRVVLVVR